MGPSAGAQRGLHNGSYWAEGSSCESEVSVFQLMGLSRLPSTRLPVACLLVTQEFLTVRGISD